MSEVTMIGLDLAKSVFQVHGVDAGARRCCASATDRHWKWREDMCCRPIFQLYPLISRRCAEFVTTVSLKLIVDPVRIGACLALVLIGFSFPARAQPVFQCSFDELTICGQGIGCSSEGSEKIDFPRRIKVDITSGILSSLDDTINLREARAQNVEQRDGVYFFQAIQQTRAESSNIVGWTLFLDSKSMMISGSVVNADIVFNVFGNCEGQSN